MNFVNFTASHNDADRRLDKIIRRLLDNIPLSVVYKYLRKGLIKLNGQRAEPDMRVRVNDIIEVAEFLLPAEKKSEKATQDNHGKNTFSATSTGNPEITGKKNGTQHTGYFSAKLPFSDIFKNRDMRNTDTSIFHSDRGRCTGWIEKQQVYWLSPKALPEPGGFQQRCNII